MILNRVNDLPCPAPVSPPSCYRLLRAATWMIFFLCTAAPGRAEEVAHWAFSEGAGTLATDSSGHGLDGALLGGPVWVDGRFGGGLDFAPAGARVLVPANPVINQLSRVTVAAWVRQPYVGAPSTIVDLRDSNSDGFSLSLDSQSFASFQVNSKTLVDNTFLGDETWHHIAGTWDGNRMRLYVDGVEVQNRRASIYRIGSIFVGAPLAIGSHYSGDPQSEQRGVLDEVRVYNHALGAAEILDLLDPAIQDQAPPVRFDATPGGTLPAGTTSATVALATDEEATCRWSALPGTSFEAMTDVFSLTGGQVHQGNFGALEDGATYTLYVRCEDLWGNRNDNDFIITFDVEFIPSAGPIAHWTFEEGVGTVALDASGLGHDAELLGGAHFAQGFVEGGLSLEATGDAAAVWTASQLGQLSALTLSAWVRSPPPSDFSSLIDFRQAGSVGYDLYLDPTGHPFFRINGDTLLAISTVADQTWHHLAAVWDGASMAVYVDGTLEASRTASSPALAVSGTLWLGRHFQNDPRFAWNGALDEVQIYDRPLDAFEVTTLAQQQRVDLEPPRLSFLEPSGILPAGTTAVALSLHTDEVASCRWSSVAGLTLAEMPNAFDTADGLDHSFLLDTLVDGVSLTHFVRCADTVGNANDSDALLAFSIDQVLPEPAGLLASWSFEEAQGLVASDDSGNGHDGVLSGNPVWTTGYLGSALSFPTTTDKVEIQHGGELGQLQALTITAWVRSAQPTDFASIVDCRDQVDSGYDFYLDNQGRPFARINKTTLIASTSVSDQTWHHLAMVWDGSRLAIYIDGTEDAQMILEPTSIATAAPVLLGSHFALGGTFGFAGSMDEVQIYDRALLGGEILPFSSARLALAPGFADKHVVQRRGNAADIPLSGSYLDTPTGPPSALEGRVVEAESGLPLPGLDWQVLDPAPAAGQWAGTLAAVPEGGWYRIELRFEDDPSVTLAPPNRIGVGLVIAALGQSSMAKLFTEIAFPEDGDLGVVDHQPAHELSHRLGYGSPRISASNRGGYLRTVSNLPQPLRGEVTGAGATRLVNNLAQELLIPVLVLDYAIDGTSILSWIDPTWVGRSNFENGLKTAGGEVELVLWFQGGTDILDGMAGSTYELHLETFFTQMQSLMPSGRDLEFFVAMQGRGDYTGIHDEAYTAIRGVQLHWPDGALHVHHAGSAIDLDLAADTYNRGDGHLTASQTQILADRFSRALFDWMGRPGYEGGVRGGEIQAASQLGNQVFVEIAQDQGSKIQVRDPSAAVEGFELSDDGFQTVWRLGAGITSASLTPDGQRVVLTLDNQLTGPLQLRYLYGMNPFGDLATQAERRAGGNTLYDDFAYHPERDGLPINPTEDALEVTPGF